MASRRAVRIVWSARAVEDLRGIADYIAQYSPRTARGIGSRIKRATSRLSRFPLSGRNVPELPHFAYRELVVLDYRIVYEATADRVEILTVVHGARDLPSRFPTSGPQGSSGERTHPSALNRPPAA